MSEPSGSIVKVMVAVVSVTEATVTFDTTGGPGGVVNCWTSPGVDAVALSATTS